MCGKRGLGTLLVLLPLAALATDFGSPGVAEELSATYCENNAFLACTGLSHNECDSALYEAASKCDYSRVLSAIEAEDYTAARAHSAVYGECVVSRLEGNLDIPNAKLHNCGARLINKMHRELNE
jgi:hypothetical protein